MYTGNRGAPRRNRGSGLASRFNITPKSIAKLVLSILIDLVGFLTYAVPALGEVADAVWAPIR